MSKVIFIIGLPGSGKTHYIENSLIPELGEDAVFDDYHSHARGNSEEFSESVYYEGVREKIKKEKDCAISDIAYCDPDRLAKVKKEILKLAKDTKKDIDIEYVYFENNPDACRSNVKQRNRENCKIELTKIDSLTTKYKYPKDAQIRKVYSK